MGIIPARFARDGVPEAVTRWLLAMLALTAENGLV